MPAWRVVWDDEVSPVEGGVSLKVIPQTSVCFSLCTPRSCLWELAAYERHGAEALLAAPALMTPQSYFP